MNVLLTKAAEQDLEAIGDYIAPDNPGHALLFIRDLREKCLGLADMPRRFPLVPRYEAQGVRRRVCGNYLILYRVDLSQIVVLRIMHGARHYAELLFPS